MINRRSSSQNKAVSRKSAIKVIALQLSLVCCTIMQIVAVGFGAFVSDWIYFGLFYNIINSLGVLLFVVVSLILYQPIFTFGLEKFTTGITHKSQETKQQATPRGTTSGTI